MATKNPDILVNSGARELVERMGETASNFLASLTPDQRSKAVLDFSDDERRNWNYVPLIRVGLSLAEMDFGQRQLAHQIAATGLSRSGYVAASTIIGLETTLDAVEDWKDSGPDRDPGMYYVTIFGEPHESKPWGWRFEGHHISLNYTIAKGMIVSPTPTFFGANPSESPLGGIARLRPLAGVEDLARDLIHLLDEEQRTAAIISPIAPHDIVMSNRPKVIEGALPISAAEMMGDPMAREATNRVEDRIKKLGLKSEHLERLRFSHNPKGVPISQLNGSQREALTDLIREYIDRMPEELGEMEFHKHQSNGLDGIHFAWAGGVERRQPHYYRIQGPRFLVEYDNTQNDANHIHSVWRDPGNDFGDDLLAHHYRIDHKH